MQTVLPTVWKISTKVKKLTVDILIVDISLVGFKSYLPLGEKIVKTLIQTGFSQDEQTQVYTSTRRRQVPPTHNT